MFGLPTAPRPQSQSGPPLADAEPLEVRDVAVLDVGSNSVRLVIYRLEGRAIWTVFTEKVLAGLGRGLAASRRLSPEGAEAALSALRRFKAVIEGAGVTEVFAAATAAVREAADGPAFIARIEREVGFHIDVLSGEDEARASALGVSAGQPDAQGVVADLGGSSLELVRLDRGEVGRGVTLPLGPLALGAGAKIMGDLDLARRTAVAELAPVDGFDTRHLHAVGGGWRNLALLHMQIVRYPLNIVHQYELSAEEALSAAALVARQSRGSLDKIPGLSKKRAETLPYAAVVLEALIERLGVERITFSAYGLREGLILQAMSPAVRARDPLIEGFRAMGAREGLIEALGPTLERWLTPLLADLPPVFGHERDARLMAAACRLADVGARLHPDHRADLVFERVLRAAVAGQNHAERAFLAVTLFARYASGSAAPVLGETARLMSEAERTRAYALGAAMRLGCDLCGRSPALLERASLTSTPTRVVLRVDRAHADLLLGEQTRKRLNTLATTLGVKAEVETRP
ncbi:Ppx/GppA phosphatase family protein [soil metagenome]